MPFGFGYYGWIVVLQGLCLLHLMRSRGDQRWFYLILFAPGLGALIYLLVEVLPALRRSGGLELPVLRRARLRRLEQQFRFSDTVANRVALAEAYLEDGRAADAIALYRPALVGVLRNDVHLRFGLAGACFAAGDLAGAREALELAAQGGSREKLRERTLLLARVLSAQGETASAEEAFRAAVKGFDGEEARCRFAGFLLDQGRRDEGEALLRESLEYAAVSDRDYRRRQRPWLREAKRLLAASTRARRAATG